MKRLFLFLIFQMGLNVFCQHSASITEVARKTYVNTPDKIRKIDFIIGEKLITVIFHHATGWSDDYFLTMAWYDKTTLDFVEAKKPFDLKYLNRGNFNHIPFLVNI